MATIYLDTHGDNGFVVTFPYDPSLVARFKQDIAGARYQAQPRKGWYSDGPEVLLDLQRYGYDVYPSLPAWDRADAFMRQVYGILDIRDTQVGDEPFGYQRIGSRMLVEQRRGILADTMGLGKTKQTINALEALYSEHGFQPTLILAPKTLTYNWLAEFTKWSDIPAVVVPEGPAKRSKFWAERPWEHSVIIATYEKVRGKDWPVIEWFAVAADEATKLKNYQAQLTKSVNVLVNPVTDYKTGEVLSTHYVPYVWLLTGTPLEIRAEELYQLMNLIRPAVFGFFTRFRDQYLITDMAGNVRGVRNPQGLSERIAPWVLRRTKEDAKLNLPPKLFNEVWVDFDAAEQRAYKTILNDFEGWLRNEGREASEMNKLTQLLRLQQFTSSPDLLKGDEDAEWRGSKFATLQELIDGWDGRVLVFTRFSEMAYRLQAWLGADERALIVGDISKAEERVQRITDFNAGRLGKVLISTDAGAHGLNVTGADLIVHYDLLWNPAKMSQREDRLHRIGQVNTVNVVRLMCQATVDAGMYYVAEERAALFNQIMDGAEEAMLNAVDLRKVARGEEPRARAERRQRDEVVDDSSYADPARDYPAWQDATGQDYEVSSAWRRA